MSSFEKIFGYWWLVISRSARSSIGLLTEFRADFLRGTLSLVALLAISFSASLGITSISPLRDIFGAREWTTFIGMLALLIPTNFVLRLFFYTPFQLYYEQKRIANKYNWFDVDFSIYNFPKTSVYGVGLLLRNDKDYDIEFVCARIINLKFVSKKRDWGMSDNIRFLPWIMDDDTPTRLPQNLHHNGGELALEIIQWNDKEVWLASGLQEEPKNRGPIGYRAPHSSPNMELGKYYFEIEFTGQIQGLELTPYIYYGEFYIREVGDVRIRSIRGI
jgi:hypothetical protein